ncbi:hypothetical protein BH18ACT2_BH18ACT2_03470 [soil metagenome]
MQPASASGARGDGGGNRQLKRWGPIIGVLAVVVIGVVVLVVTRGGGDDDNSVSTASTEAGTTVAESTPPPTAGGGSTPDTTGGDDTEPSTTAGGDDIPPATEPAEITYPLSFSQAEEAGLDIDFGDRCDPETGLLAVPDYFAPECYAPFEGDNGGATAPGVTADEITLVYYIGQEADPIIKYITDAIDNDDTNADDAATIENLVRYYETYYELYGRTVNLVTYEGTGGATEEVAARADAQQIAEEFQPFAVLGGPALTSAFADELAARQILCVSCTPGQPAQFYADRDPYVWGVDGSPAQKQAHVIEFIAKQLIGQPAVHGGDAVIGQTRVFGLVYIESSSNSKVLADAFAAEMAALGAPFAEVIPYQLDPASIQQTASQIITRLKAAGVTTVVFSGDPVAPRDFTREATAQEYFPEWVIAAATLTDLTAFARTYDQEQWAHAFGVTSLAARNRPQTSGYYSLYVWFNGVEPPANDTIGVLQPPLAVFFSTAQAAGPDLTAETWRDALFAGEGTTAAISQPFLSWGDHGYWPDADYSGIDDATVLWWDPVATGPDEIRKVGTGMYQYVDGGKRYLPGQWPTEDQLFVPDGAVSLYETPPPGESPPTYPSPAG